MLLNAVYVLVGLVGLFLGGNWLVKGASRLAASLGIPPLVIGLTVVSFGTSTPELLVSLSAALQGSSDIAFGNVVGSNIANIGLILAISGLILMIPIQIGLIRREIPLVILASVALLLLAVDGEISSLDGLLLVIGLVLFNILVVRSALRERLSQREERELQEEEAITGEIKRTHELGRIIIGLVALLIGANLLVDGAVAIARTMGVSELIIGVTLVAVGTSLPELVTSLAAALRRHEDILFGNVIGSNLFNILGILGITALIRPMSVPASTLRFELPVMIGFALALLLFVPRRKITRIESIFILAAYIIFVIVAVSGSNVAV
ncbi:MAG: calcium/sodium antiporter [Anaerolineae bacterium]|nr:calcium/sodium antiporter [Anaerolineae bacterium]